MSLDEIDWSTRHAAPTKQRSEWVAEAAARVGGKVVRSKRGPCIEVNSVRLVLVPGGRVEQRAVWRSARARGPGTRLRSRFSGRL